MDLLSSVALSPQAQGKIAVLVADVAWATDEHRDRVMTAVLGMGSSAGDGAFQPTRRQNQSWEHCVHALPRSVWVILEDPAVSADSKIGAVHTFLSEMGLRLPTEGTSKAMCELILVASEGLEMASQMAPAVKAAFNSKMKKLFKRKVRRMPAPTEWVDELPASIDFLGVSHRDLYQRVYVDTHDRHVNCKWSAAQMAGVAASFPCRTSSCLLRGASGATRARIDIPVGCPI